MAEAQVLDFSFDDGARAVELARDAVESYVLHGQREQLGSMREAFYARTGALVRLESVGGAGGLRGCAGSPDDDGQLGHVLVDAAIEAASRDSCGSEVEGAELRHIKVSVCIIRDLFETVDPVGELEIGRHGLVVDAPGGDGWMYPTIPAEHGWTVHEYLDRTCRKIGLSPSAWEDEESIVSLFDGIVFRERNPGGTIQQA